MTFDEIEVIAPNLKWLPSGVTATIARLLPVQARSVGIVATGAGLPAHVPNVPLRFVVGMSGRRRRKLATPGGAMDKLHRRGFGK